MAQLTEKDLTTVLELSLEAQACSGLAEFSSEFLPQLRRLVPYDQLGYNEVDLAKGTARILTDPPEVAIQGAEERLMRVIHQHPLAARQSRGDLRPYLLSDFLTAREFHRLDLYHDLYRLLDAEDQIAFGLPGPVIVAIALSRCRRSFTERDRQVLEVLRPHLSSVWARLVERDSTAALVSILEDGLERRHAGVVQFDRRGRLAHVSASARQLLDAYCGNGSKPWRVPAAVEGWMGPSAPPLNLDGPRGRLRLRMIDGHDDCAGILVEELRSSPPAIDRLVGLGLTERQAQVTRLLACGKSSQRIARELRISTPTVRKHLEHVYDRLGVSSRSEAIARVNGC